MRNRTVEVKPGNRQASDAGRGRVALLTPYFPFFDGVFSDDYRRAQERNARELAGLIASAGFEVHHLGLTDSSEKSMEHGRELAAGEPDVLVVAPVMAAPATHSVPAVELVDRPTVLVEVARRKRFEEGYTEVQATEDSTLLGCIMASAGLRGGGRPFFQKVLSEEASREDLWRGLDGAVGSERLSGQRVGLLGDKLKGYVDVDMSVSELEGLGLDGIEIPGAELVEAFERVDEVALAGAYEVLARWDPIFETGRPALDTDLRLAVALEVLVARYELSGLALNCHGTLMRKSPSVGIPACLAASVVASNGCPVTCTGDVSTIVALLVSKLFTDRVLYCEPFTFEYVSSRVVLGSCGIGNTAIAGPERVRVCKNYAYPGCVSSGSCVRFGLPPGDATMLAYAPDRPGDQRGGSLLCTTGKLAGDYFPNMHGPNAVLELDSPDPMNVLERWIAAGPAHHVALADGDLSVELRALEPFTAVRINMLA